MAGSQDMIMIVVMMMMMSSVFAVLSGGAYVFTKPQEGDECKGTSVGGNYVIDEGGECVLDYCDSGYTESNGGCVVVVPDGEEDEEDEDEDEDESVNGSGVGDGTEYIVYDTDMAYPESGHTELGSADSVEACRTKAKSKFYNTFGFRDSSTGMPNTCWAYNWSPDLTVLGNAQGHYTGCVKPGEDIKFGGCSFVGNVYPESDMPYPSSGHKELGTGTSFEDCRVLATAAGKTAVGFRNNRSSGPNTCWAYRNASELIGVQPNKVTPHHFVGCTTDDKDITQGCV